MAECNRISFINYHNLALPICNLHDQKSVQPIIFRGTQKFFGRPKRYGTLAPPPGYAHGNNIYQGSEVPQMKQTVNNIF
jgi:hypothetical protein